MERFAFKIDKALKANLYTICRLCGIDNPDKVPILTDISAPVSVECEPDLSQKISDCIGFQITKDDKMPQSMCTLCVDKINDFYEFREMCFATNAQTRKLLGLKKEDPKKYAIVDIKPLVKPIVDEELPQVSGGKRVRKRKSEELSNPATRPDVKKDLDEVKIEELAATCRKKLRLIEPLALAHHKKIKLLTPQQKRLADRAAKQLEQQKLKPKEEIKDEPSDTAAIKVAATKVGTTKSVGVKEAASKEVTPKETPIILSTATKLKQLCHICDQRFGNKALLERHQSTSHIPNIPRFVCTACDETIKKTNDIKNHQLWHKLSKTPYSCGLCGESLISIYAYSRHLREHTFEVPTALLVLHRECPQCRETFATNFLYNTHGCAVRTKKCAGCNRQQRSEPEYLRHAATCTKSYLNYTKHIPAAEVAAESSVQIKNENDVEAAAAAEALARNAGISLNMTPVVSLTRLTSPILMAANQCVVIPTSSQSDAARTSKRGGKKGVSKKELRRVDELLKSTIDAFVSIKHEPEVHVETDIANVPHLDANEDTNDNNACDGAVGAIMEDLYDDNGEDVGDINCSSDNVQQEVNCNIDIAVKQEVIDDTFNDPNNSLEIHIKKEVMISEDNVEATSTGKMPVLKIKIKKEHGKLNSSLVCTRSEKKKKKKKRKDAERNKEKSFDKNQNSDVEIIDPEPNTDISMPQPGVILIKQERNYDDEVVKSIANNQEGNEQMKSQPEATVMTSIPFDMQFQIACISSGVEFSSEEISQVPSQLHTDQQEVELPDVKPNRTELDQMMKIAIVNSGVEMSTEEQPMHAEEATNTEVLIRKRKPPAKKAKQSFKAECSFKRQSTGKAVKSTGGVPRKNTNDMLRIVAISSGIDMPHISAESQLVNIVVKAEPSDRGYSDEIQGDQNIHMEADKTTSSQPNDFMISKVDDEQSYINSIDFNNINIKQEKYIEVSEIELSNTDVSATMIHNGLKAVKRKYNLQYHNKKSNLSCNKFVDEENAAEDSEEETEFEAELEDDSEEEPEVEEEEREYRELELPPPLLIGNADCKSKTLYDENNAGDVIATCIVPKDLATDNVQFNHDIDNRLMDLELKNEKLVPMSTTFVISNVCSQAPIIKENFKISEEFTGQKDNTDKSSNTELHINCDFNTIKVFPPSVHQEGTTEISYITQTFTADNLVDASPVPHIEKLLESHTTTICELHKIANLGTQDVVTTHEENFADKLVDASPISQRGKLPEPHTTTKLIDSSNNKCEVHATTNLETQDIVTTHEDSFAYNLVDALPISQIGTLPDTPHITTELFDSSDNKCEFHAISNLGTTPEDNLTDNLVNSSPISQIRKLPKPHTELFDSSDDTCEVHTITNLEIQAATTSEDNIADNFVDALPISHKVKLTEPQTTTELIDSSGDICGVHAITNLGTQGVVTTLEDNFKSILTNVTSKWENNHSSQTSSEKYDILIGENNKLENQKFNKYFPDTEVEKKDSFPSSNSKNNDSIPSEELPQFSKNISNAPQIENAQEVLELNIKINAETLISTTPVLNTKQFSPTSNSKKFLQAPEEQSLVFKEDKSYEFSQLVNAANFNQGIQENFRGELLQVLAGEVIGESDHELQAKPFSEENTNNQLGDQYSSMDDGESDTELHEELGDNDGAAYQNMLNQEMVEQGSSSVRLNIQTAPAFQLHPYLEDISSSSGSAFSCSIANTSASTSTTCKSLVAKTNNEETDNLTNESADAAMRQNQIMSRGNLSLNQLLLDDININEIAENNNNANIERELRDDNARLEPNSIQFDSSNLDNIDET